jgi:hypothetical protein
MDPEVSPSPPILGAMTTADSAASGRLKVDAGGMKKRILKKAITNVKIHKTR